MVTILQQQVERPKNNNSKPSISDYLTCIRNMEATRAASVAAAAEGSSADTVGLTVAAAAAAVAAAEASAAAHRKQNPPGINKYHSKGGRQKDPKASPMCVGGPPVPRCRRQHLCSGGGCSGGRDPWPWP